MRRPQPHNMFRLMGRMGAILLSISVGISAAQAAESDEDAEDGVVDCATLNDLTFEKSYEAKQADIENCINRGWDPPVTWRPDEGKGRAVRFGGSGGFGIGGISAPDEPPGKMGAASSVSSATFSFTLNFPPWKGFPCQIPGGPNLCSGSGGGGGGGVTGGGCPMLENAGGVFGARQPLGGTTAPLTCGGTMPLSAYRMALVQTPIGAVATEDGSRYLWSYKKTTTATRQTSYALNPARAMALPTRLCEGGRTVVELQPPIAQMVSYNASTQSIALRLKPLVAATDEEDAPPPTTPEKFLIIPIKNGLPEIPSGCPTASNYYKTADAIGADMIVETTLEPRCEAEPDVCNAAGAPVTPIVDANCEAVAIYPAAPTTDGTDRCAGKVQSLVLNRPNLVHPPGANPVSLPMQGRTTQMVPTTQGSLLYAHAETIFRLPASSQSFTLPEGGLLQLRNNLVLQMNGPVTINMATRQITLTNGGEARDSGGTSVARYTAKSVMIPPADLPYTLTIGRNIAMPVGYYLPSQPSPYVQLPAGGN